MAFFGGSVFGNIPCPILFFKGYTRLPPCLETSSTTRATIAISIVLSAGAKIKMGRADTMTVTTTMSNDKTRKNGAIGTNPGDTMREGTCSLETDTTMSVWCYRPSPEPTLPCFMNFVPEENISGRDHRETPSSEGITKGGSGWKMMSLPRLQTACHLIISIV